MRDKQNQQIFILNLNLKEKLQVEVAIKWNDLSSEIEEISKEELTNQIELEKYNASITNKEKQIDEMREKINDEQNNFSKNSIGFLLYW